jgi:septum formation topological specificity factor MinE
MRITTEDTKITKLRCEELFEIVSHLVALGDHRIRVEACERNATIEALRANSQCLSETAKH